MRLSLQWLQDYQLDVEADVLAHRLTMAGLEVDAIEPAAPAFTQVVVGEVVQLEAHPDADKLRVAMVDIGQGESLQIVCGAPNVAKGVKVPTALIGAVLPGDFKIKKSKLRGVESCGMLCSDRELGLSEAHDGLMLLPNDAPVGENIRHYLQLDDIILDIDLTPNRADAFSMRGLAREIGVLFNQQPKFMSAPQNVESSKESPIKVVNDSHDACLIYHARVIDDIDMSASTPLWMAERLRRAGVRPHDPVVDVTNYVMLALGTPMHAFDRDKVSGDIQVRFARDNEALTLLNGNKVTLADDVLVIADTDKALAIAGVMGGEDSACQAQTRHIVLESAWFDPVCIAGKARRFGLSSDAAQRFERGVDMTLQMQALDMATQLIIEICGGNAYQAASSVLQDRFPEVSEIELPRSQITRLIGRDYDDATVENILIQLGCDVNKTSSGWLVTPPSWRFDLRISEDLIEEVVRVKGYDNVEAVMPTLSYRASQQGKQHSRYWVDKLVEQGFQEAITYSFVDQQAHEIFFPNQQAILLSNPISAQLSQMRLSLLPGLVNSVMYNRHRQQQNLRFFEIGNAFIPQGDKAQDCLQEERLAGVISGAAQPEQWSLTNRHSDFFDIKGVVETLLVDTANVGYRETEKAYLHPGQSADIYINNAYAGVVGSLHPNVQKALGIKGNPVWVFELSTAHLQSSNRAMFAQISKYPTVRRDLALVVDKDVAANVLEKQIVDICGESLTDMFWFDLYEGENLPAQKKSLAVALLLQSKDKTLQDEEVERIIARLVEKLKETFGAELR